MLIIYETMQVALILPALRVRRRGKVDVESFFAPFLPPCITQSVDDGEEYWQESTAIQRRGAVARSEELFSIC